MRYLILSDLHANLQALDAVIEDAQAIGYDAVLVLGDLVGYGADPAAVIDRTLALEPAAMIRGNHDKVCAGIESPLLFNDAARVSAEWTAEVLDEEHLGVLRSLPKGPQLVNAGIEICHGTPFDEDHYVFDDHDASRAADSARARICLFGHTHVPAIYATAQDPVVAAPEATDLLRLPREAPALINVGSVGQPRDGDPRAAYGVLDLEAGTLQLRRVPYDIAAAQSAILTAGLPEWLAFRLERGQ
ncbi:MAG TPA: metallophosphoesterase family protein [Vicinamibacterales bacterium]|nr:metallophosphoesterase family protein [Vicinamibacterales bacterium]